MSLPEPRSLLPHRSSAAFLDRIVSFRPPEILCEATLASSSPYVRDGRAESFLGIELVAQAASVATTLARAESEAGRGRSGYVALVSEAAFLVQELPVGSVLSVRAHETWSDGLRASYEGEVSALGRVLVRVALSVVERP